MSQKEIKTQKDIDKLKEELSQKEIERQKDIDKLDEKEKLIGALRESLHKQTDQKIEFEQKWKAAILEMKTNGTTVNDKQREIDQLTKELDISKTKVS